MNEREQRARETAGNLANVVNEMGFDVDVFADELLRQHRTPVPASAPGSSACYGRARRPRCASAASVSSAAAIPAPGAGSGTGMNSIESIQAASNPAENETSFS